MSMRSDFAKFAGIAGLCLATTLSAQAATQHKKKQAAPPPPLPSGPTGPIQQMPLDSIAAVAPQVNYQNGQLTIVAPNSTLGDILRAVKKQTGAEIDVPQATDRVVTRLGPGPARDVMAELLNGSRFNYVLLGSPEDSSLLTRVVLVAKSAPEASPGGVSLAQQQPMQQAPPVMQQQVNMAPPPQEVADDQNADQAEENAPDAEPDQAAAEAEQQQQQQQQGDQPGVKTPQQMLQEMQQRQMQLQQMQQPGQPPIPGSGMPPHPPQEP